SEKGYAALWESFAASILGACTQRCPVRLRKALSGLHSAPAGILLVSTTGQAPAREGFGRACRVLSHRDRRLREKAQRPEDKGQGAFCQPLGVSLRCGPRPVSQARAQEAVQKTLIVYPGTNFKKLVSY